MARDRLAGVKDPLPDDVPGRLSPVPVPAPIPAFDPPTPAPTPAEPDPLGPGAGAIGECVKGCP